MLACDCGYDAEWYYHEDKDWSLMPKFPQRRRCCSCGQFIEPNDIVQKFICYRPPHDEIEEEIHGDEVPMADKFMCEECGDIYWSLTDLGFCISLGSESMKNLLEEYKQEYVK